MDLSVLQGLQGEFIVEPTSLIRGSKAAMIGVPPSLPVCRAGSITCTATAFVVDINSSRWLVRADGLPSVEPFATSRTTRRPAFGQRFSYPALEICRTRNGSVKTLSSERGGGRGPPEEGDSVDGFGGRFDSKEDLWNDLFENGNPSSIVDFEFLERAVSDEARNAFLWAASSSVCNLIPET